MALPLDAAALSFHIDAMKGVRDLYGLFGWALSASLILHLLVALFLLYQPSVSLSKPDEEQAIKVELVPAPKPPEKAKVEPPPAAKKPEPEKPPEQKEATVKQPLPAMQPVVQFGEKDAGPRLSPKGSGSEDGSASQQPDKAPQENQPRQPAAEAKNNDQPSGGPKPGPKATDAAKPQEAVKLKKAKTLFSQAATGDLIATTAMGAVPRSVRAGRLCVTELREQLRHNSPAYFPDLLPSYSLYQGTVIDAPRAAFRVDGIWVNVGYRCEVDSDATKVVSFALRVGGPIPRSEWQRRRLPAN